MGEEGERTREEIRRVDELDEVLVGIVRGVRTTFREHFSVLRSLQVSLPVSLGTFSVQRVDDLW